MNRSERRRQEKQDRKKEKVYTFTQSEIQALKQKMTKAIADELLAKVLGISVMIIHDKFGKLMKREVDGKSREQRFTELWMDSYHGFEEGYFTFEDIQDVLREECNMIVRKEGGYGL